MHFSSACHPTTYSTSHKIETAFSSCLPSFSVSYISPSLSSLLLYLSTTRFHAFCTLHWIFYMPPLLLLPPFFSCYLVTTTHISSGLVWFWTFHLPFMPTSPLMPASPVCHTVVIYRDLHFHCTPVLLLPLFLCTTLPMHCMCFCLVSCTHFCIFHCVLLLHKYYIYTPVCILHTRTHTGDWL